MKQMEEKRVHRTRYDNQFKADAVRHLIESGKTIKAVAADLGVELIGNRFPASSDTRPTRPAVKGDFIVRRVPSGVDASSTKPRLPSSRFGAAPNRPEGSEFTS